jgi:hypothetical protein
VFTDNDPSVWVQPPFFHVKEHVNLHHSLVWTTWNITWPLVRLGMDYLTESYEKTKMSAGGDDGSISDQEIVNHARTLLQADLTNSMNENINNKIFDVLLGNLFQEPVRASVVGNEVYTYTTELLPEEGGHIGSNMTPVDLLERRKIFESRTAPHASAGWLHHATMYHKIYLFTWLFEPEAEATSRSGTETTQNWKGIVTLARRCGGNAQEHCFGKRCRVRCAAS